MTDDQLESIIEASDGHFVDDEFRISGKDLMNLLRAVHCAAPPPASTNKLTDEKINAAIVEWFNYEGDQSDFRARMRAAIIAATENKS